MVLSDLRKGEEATIQDISLLNHVMKKRLTDLGFRKGSIVSVKTVMPFGGPFVIESSGQQIGIRVHEANHIKVRVR